MWKIQKKCTCRREWIKHFLFDVYNSQIKEGKGFSNEDVVFDNTLL